MKTKLNFLLPLILFGALPLHASFETEKEKSRGEETRSSTTEANTTAAAVNAAHHVPVRDSGTTAVLLQREDEGGGAATSLEQQDPVFSSGSQKRRNVTPRRERPRLKEVSTQERATSLAAAQSTLSDNIRSYAAAIEKVNEARKKLHEVKRQQEVLLKEWDRRENDFIAVNQQFETAERNVATFEALKDSTRRNGLLYNASLQEREWARVACQARGRLARGAALDFTRHATEYLEANERVYDAQTKMVLLRNQFSRQREPLLSQLNTIASDVERALEGEGSGITEARGKFNNTFKAAEDSKIAALEAVRTRDDFNKKDAFKEVFGELFYPPGEKKEEDDDEIIGAVQYEMEQAFEKKHYQNGDVNSDFSDEEDEEEVATKRATYERMAEYAEEKLSQLSGLTGAQKIVTQLYADLREREKEITIQEQQAMVSEAPLTQAMFETMHTCASIKPFQEDEILGTVIHLSEYEKLTDSLNEATAKAEAMQHSWEDVSKAVENYREARLRWGMSMVHLIMTFKKLANPHEFLSASVEARDAEFVGRLWVGKDFSIRTPNPERKDALCCLVSKDQLRQYRAPSLKPYEKEGKIAAVAPQNALQGVNILANYEWKKEPSDRKWTGDIHLSIADIVTKQQLATYQQDWATRYSHTFFTESTKAVLPLASRLHSSENEGHDVSSMSHANVGDDPEGSLSANITERGKNSSSSASKDERSSSADDGSEK